MARKKEIPTNNSNPEENPEVAVETKEAVVETKEPTAETKEIQIPDRALRVLKIYSDCPLLYVDSKGGAFDPDTKPQLGSDAILYKNPYYQPKNK